MARDMYEFKYSLFWDETTKFTKNITGTGTITFNYTNGVTLTHSTPTTATDDVSYDQSAGLNLTNSAASIEWTAVPTSDANMYSQFRLEQNATNSVQFELVNGNLFCYQVVATVQTQRGSTITYDNTTHRFLRIREGTFAGGTKGTLYWDYSADGQSWTNHTSVATPITVTSIFAITNTFCLAIIASGSTLSARNLNIVNSKSFKNRSLRPYPFSPGLAR